MITTIMIKGTDCELEQRLDANSLVMIIRIIITSLGLNADHEWALQL